MQKQPRTNNAADVKPQSEDTKNSFPLEGDGKHNGRPLPKAEAVTTVDPDKNKGLAAKIASSNRNGNPKLTMASDGEGK